MIGMRWELAIRK